MKSDFLRIYPKTPTSGAPGSQCRYESIPYPSVPIFILDY